MQQPSDQKNLFLAIGLSVLVIIGWNAFYGVPQMERQRQAQQQGTPAPGPQAAGEAGRPGTVAPGAPAAPGQPAGAPTAAPVSGVMALDRRQVLGQSPRVTIDTPRLAGSLALRGGRIDDLVLKDYRETVDKNSDKIVLFSPAGAPAPFYAEFGWVVAPGAPVAVPTATTLWTADRDRLGVDQPVTLSWDNGQGLLFRRTISVDRNYLFTVRETVENTSAQPVVLFPYSLISRHGTPPTQGFFIMHEGLIGVVGDAGLQQYTYSDIAKDRTKTWKGTGGFVGITDKYWAATLIPDQATPFDGRFVSAPLGSLPTYQTDILKPGQTVAPGAMAAVTTKLFAGAKEVQVVDGYEKTHQIRQFDLLIDWGWFYFFTKPMFYVLDWLYRLTGNFGVAILLITVLIKAAFFPLANKSYESMAKMKIVQPMMLEIQQRYKDDKMKQQQALMELYKKEKINPIAGCWPVLIQIPVFFALYKVLFVTIEMRQAPFFGWIQDLAAQDPTSIVNLFGLLPFTVPQFLQIGVWPIIMGITMWLQMKMNPEPTDPIQKAVFGWMPLIFTFMLASFPAGLVIYWAWNNLLSIAQQYVIMRRAGAKVELWDNLRAMFKKNAPAKG